MRRLVGLLALSGLLLVNIQPATAQEILDIVDTGVTSDFPQAITFYLTARGPADITDAEVRFRIESRTCAQVENSGFAEVTPGRLVTTEWTWDTRRGGSLPPGATVQYRWKVRDDAGGVAEGDEQSYEVTDDRHAWRTISRGGLTVSWYSSDQTFAETLMQSALDALDRLEVSTGIRPLGTVKLFIYASAQELQESLVFPQEWTGGVSFTGFDIVAIGIPPGSLVWGQRAIAHELTHVVMDQLTFSCISDVPAWLSEGLATFNEDPVGATQPQYVNSLNRAVGSDSLLSVRSLSGSFPTAQDAAILAYGQSFSLVDFLVNTRGTEGMESLLSAFRSGSTTDVALEHVYGFDQSGLEVAWRDYIGAQPMAEVQGIGTPTLPVPAIPTFAPFTLDTPTPSDSTSLQQPTTTPSTQPSGGGCNAGLPLPSQSDETTPLSMLLGLLPVTLAGLVLGVRRRRKG